MKIKINKKNKIKCIRFLDIKFNNFCDEDLLKILENFGLFVFPAAPALTDMKINSNYHKSLICADYVFFDSGYLVILLRFLKGIKVKKFSGYKFLQLLFEYLKMNKSKNLFLIDPSINVSKKNFELLDLYGLKNTTSYIAPIYEGEKIEDQKLLEKLNKIKPDFIIVNIGGGKQEILGNYIKKKINFNTKIICTGAAISFFTKEQAPINFFYDKLYIGWLIRIIFNPKIFLPRYLKSIKLFLIVFKNKISIEN
tara:strand:- start:2 stop:760 length:759 start_codon:yes stop_codon:yes gene_type:complete